MDLSRHGGRLATQGGTLILRDARSCFGFRSPLIEGTDRHRDIA